MWSHTHCGTTFPTLLSRSMANFSLRFSYFRISGDKILWLWCLGSIYLFVYLFCGTGAWTQGLHLEQLQPFFVIDFFQNRVSWTVCLDWLWTLILLIAASWVARIIDVSHRRPSRLPLIIILWPNSEIVIFLTTKVINCIFFFNLVVVLGLNGPHTC
jgi:hypothetical protein